MKGVLKFFERCVFEEKAEEEIELLVEGPDV